MPSDCSDGYLLDIGDKFVAVQDGAVPNYLIEVLEAGNLWIDSRIKPGDNDVMQILHAQGDLVHEAAFPVTTVPKLTEEDNPKITFRDYDIDFDFFGHSLEGDERDDYTVQYKVKDDNTDWLEIKGIVGANDIVQFEHVGPSETQDFARQVGHLDHISRTNEKLKFAKSFDKHDKLGHHIGNEGILGHEIEFVETKWIEIEASGPVRDIEIEFTHADPQLECLDDDLETFTIWDWSADVQDPALTGAQIILVLNADEYDEKGHKVRHHPDIHPDIEWIIPEIIGDLIDVSKDAPTTGDILQWDGTEWGPVSPVQVTVISDFQVDGSTQKLQKKTRLITVIASDAESGWTDIHTGTECP